MEISQLPEPHFTVIIQANEANPFGYIADEIKRWLADHPDKEDILVGQHANEQTLPDFRELQLLGPHPLLEKQMKRYAPIRWLHVKLELAEHPDNWIRLVLRADNFYCNGLANRPDHGRVQTFEFTEPLVPGQNNSDRKELLPKEWNPVLLPWNLKYHELIGCENEDAAIIENLLAMADDPQFLTESILHWSFYDPTGNQPAEAKRMVAGIIFKEMTTETPLLMEKVWHWGDVSKEQRKWKKSKYKGVWNEKLKDCGCTGPRDGLQLLALVLNEANGPEIDRKLAQEMENPNAPNKHQTKDAGSTKKNPASTNKHQTNDAGSTEKKPASTDTAMDNMTQRTRHVPLGRCRIQILKISANFEIEEINAHDWHRVQTIYLNIPSEVHQVADTSHLMLCGPRRAIGAYGHFGIDIYPAKNIMGPPKKKIRNETGQTQLICDSWNVSTIYDEAPTIYSRVITASSDRKLEITFLHIPNTIEAAVKVLCKFEDISEVTGYIKATATGYQDIYVDLFSREPNQKLIVQSGEWKVLPLLLNLLCVPYSADMQLKVTVDIEIRKQGGTAKPLLVTHSFQNKEENIQSEIDENSRIAVQVTMCPNPQS